MGPSEGAQRAGSLFFPHLRVVAREDFQGDGWDELADEVQPLFVEADLLHMNIVRGHRLIAASDPLVLREKHNMECA